MRRYRSQKSTFFRGRERSRLLVMIGMMVLLFLLIQRAKRPQSWEWLAEADQAATGQTEEGSVDTDRIAEPDKAATDSAETAKSNPAKANPETTDPPAAAPKPDAELYDRLPPDEDDWEQEQFAKNLETVIGRDKQPGLHKLEMPAYWQLLGWANRQSAAGIAKRKASGITYDQMTRRPNEQRGKLAKVKLNVRRVVKQPAEKGNPLGVDQVYELIGFSEESVSALYYCIVPELPEGMPVGLTVNENVTFVGYFLKLQGYQRGEVTPEERYYYAPLLLGRIVWQAPVINPPEEPTWAWWVVGGIGVAMAVAVVGWIVRPRGKVGPVLPTTDDADKQVELNNLLSRPREPWESGPHDHDCGPDNDEPDDDPADAWKRMSQNP